MHNKPGIDRHLWEIRPIRDLFIFGALSDLGYTIRVTDTASGALKTYVNPPGTYCGGLDSSAF